MGIVKVLLHKKPYSQNSKLFAESLLGRKMAEVNKMTVVIPAGCVRIDFGMEAWNWEGLKLMLALVPQINTFVGG
jgi:hypothetical protein